MAFILYKSGEGRVGPAGEVGQNEAKEEMLIQVVCSSAVAG